MELLTFKTLKRLQQESYPSQEWSLFVRIMLRWISLIDFETVLAYLKATIDTAHTTNVYNRKLIWTFDEVKSWVEPRVRQHLVSWVMEPIINYGFRSIDDTAQVHELIDQGNTFSEVELTQNDAILVSQLLELPITKVIVNLSEAITVWAWTLDPKLIRQTAIATKHYEDYWEHKDLISYVFFCLYLEIYDSLLQGEFTERLLEQWRS